MPVMGVEIGFDIVKRMDKPPTPMVIVTTPQGGLLGVTTGEVVPGRRPARRSQSDTQRRIARNGVGGMRRAQASDDRRTSWPSY